MSGSSQNGEVEEWLRIARLDWHRIRVLLADGDGAAAGFYLQQSLEKYLKAFLVSQGRQPRKIHALQALLDEISPRAAGVVAFRGLCERVSGYYVLERYPFTGEGPDVRQVEADLHEARALITTLFPGERLE